MTAEAEFTLDPATRRLAEERASRLGIPVAEYVRQIIANDLAQGTAHAPIEEIFDIGSSAEPTDIMRDKHKLIGEAYGAGFRTKP